MRRPSPESLSDIRNISGVDNLFMHALGSEQCDER